MLQKPLSEKMHAQEQSCTWREKDHMAEKIAQKTRVEKESEGQKKKEI